MPTQTNTRLDYLDAVRSFALILGIVFHASLSFIPIYIGWAVMDVSTSDAVSIFALISHSFRMELFFLIAGFFAHMTFHQRGVREFFKSRLVRLAIPFILGWVILRPLLTSGWVMGGQSLRGDVNISAALADGLKSLANIPNDLLVGTHLWFLYYLIMISTSVVLLRYLLSVNKPMMQKLTLVSDNIVAWVCQSKIAIAVVAIPTAGCLWFMQGWGIDTPDKSLIPHIPVALIYGGFFSFGWFLHRQTNLLEQFAKLSWGKFCLCLIAILAAIVLSIYQSETGHPQYQSIKAGFLLSYAIMMWTLVSLTIGVCKRLFNRPSKIVKYIADSSYWLYLIHLPLVVWLQVAFAELPFHWSIKLTAICVITLGVSIIIYDIFIRSTFVGTTLNGKRQPRVMFAGKQQ